MNPGSQPPQLRSQTADFLLIGTLIQCKGRSALCIFPQIKVTHKRILCPHQKISFRPFLYKIVENFIPGQTAVIQPCQSPLLIIVCQLLIQNKGVLPPVLQIFQRPGKLSAVVIHLHHVLNPFQLQHIIIGQPFGRQHLIGWLISVNQSIVLCLLIHERAL